MRYAAAIHRYMCEHVNECARHRKHQRDIIYSYLFPWEDVCECDVGDREIYSNADNKTPYLTRIRVFSLSCSNKNVWIGNYYNTQQSAKHNSLCGWRRMGPIDIVAGRAGWNRDWARQTQSRNKWNQTSTTIVCIKSSIIEQRLHRHSFTLWQSDTAQNEHVGRWCYDLRDTVIIFCYDILQNVIQYVYEVEEKIDCISECGHVSARLCNYFHVCLLIHDCWFDFGVYVWVCVCMSACDARHERDKYPVASTENITPIISFNAAFLFITIANFVINKYLMIIIFHISVSLFISTHALHSCLLLNGYLSARTKQPMLSAVICSIRQYFFFLFVPWLVVFRLSLYE